MKRNYMIVAKHELSDFDSSSEDHVNDQDEAE
jgi:hypothetical protein